MDEKRAANQNNLREGYQEMRPSMRALITSIYTEQRVLISMVLEIDKLFRETCAYKKEIEYLSIPEFFDSIVQDIR